MRELTMGEEAYGLRSDAHEILEDIFGNEQITEVDGHIDKILRPHIEELVQLYDKKAIVFVVAPLGHYIDTRWGWYDCKMHLEPRSEDSKSIEEARRKIVNALNLCKSEGIVNTINKYANANFSVEYLTFALLRNSQHNINLGIELANILNSDELHSVITSCDKQTANNLMSLVCDAAQEFEDDTEKYYQGINCAKNLVDVIIKNKDDTKGLSFLPDTYGALSMVGKYYAKLADFLIRFKSDSVTNSLNERQFGFDSNDPFCLSATQPYLEGNFNGVEPDSLSDAAIYHVLTEYIGSTATCSEIMAEELRDDDVADDVANEDFVRAELAAGRNPYDSE